MNLVATVVGALIAWHVLLLTGKRQFTSGHQLLEPASRRDAHLQHFVKSVQRAEPALRWIREQSEIVVGVRNKRQVSLESLPSSWKYWDRGGGYGEDGDDEGVGGVGVGDLGGDLWYNRFRESECVGNVGAYCNEFRGQTEVQVMETGSAGKDKADVDWFETYKNYGNNITLEDVMKSPDLDVDTQINAIKEKAQQSMDKASNDDVIPDDPLDMPILSRNYRNLEDQLETKRNDLSHEANYKLSKFEQDHPLLNVTARVKRSAELDNARNGRPVEILSRTAGGISPDLLNALAENSRPEGDYEEELDDEPDTNFFPELKNCSAPIKATVHAFLNRSNVSDTEQKDNAVGRRTNQVGITLEVKINNVTRQRIQTLDDLRRRKKDTDNHRGRRNRIENDSLEDLVSGKQPAQLINAIFEMVRSNDRMKQHIRPLININDKVKVFSVDNREAQNKLKANGLLSQILASMNDIIRDQVNEQTCVTLRPDLQRYVDEIRGFYAQQRLDAGRSADDDDEDDDDDNDADDDLSGRQRTPKRRSSQHKRSLPWHNFDRNLFKRSCNRNSIHEKYVIIVELLGLYERLAGPDRLRAVPQKRYLEDHLHLLDDLESFVRTLQTTAEASAVEDARIKKDVMEPPSSDRFRKLVRTVQLMRKNAVMTDAEMAANDMDVDSADAIFEETYEYP